MAEESNDEDAVEVSGKSDRSSAAIVAGKIEMSENRDHTTISRVKSETFVRKIGFNRYEDVKFNYCDILSRCRCFERSCVDKNFRRNRHSRRYIASREGVDRARLR